MLSSKNLNQIC